LSSPPRPAASCPPPPSPAADTQLFIIQWSVQFFFSGHTTLFNIQWSVQLFFSGHIFLTFSDLSSFFFSGHMSL
jgi:hypothetical protein